MYSLKLREIRKSKKITQSELAEKIGVSERIVGGWERGETGLPLDDAYRCALALGCTPNDLCGWHDEHPRDDARSALSARRSRADAQLPRVHAPVEVHHLHDRPRGSGRKPEEEAERASSAGVVSEAV